MQIDSTRGRSNPGFATKDSDTTLLGPIDKSLATNWMKSCNVDIVSGTRKGGNVEHALHLIKCRNAVRLTIAGMSLSNTIAKETIFGQGRKFDTSDTNGCRTFQGRGMKYSSRRGLVQVGL